VRGSAPAGFAVRERGTGWAAGSTVEIPAGANPSLIFSAARSATPNREVAPTNDD